MLLQEHKVPKESCVFVHKRLGAAEGFWSPAERTEGGNAKGGLAVLVGERYKGKVKDAGVDTTNGFLWVVLATTAGLIGIVNVYAPHTPGARARKWHRLVQAIDPEVPWVLGGDFNFVERRQDKKGGLRFRHKEEDFWMECRSVELGVADPWILRPTCVESKSPVYTCGTSKLLSLSGSGLTASMFPSSGCIGWSSSRSMGEPSARITTPSPWTWDYLMRGPGNKGECLGDRGFSGPTWTWQDRRLGRRESMMSCDTGCQLASVCLHWNVFNRRSRNAATF